MRVDTAASLRHTEVAVLAGKRADELLAHVGRLIRVLGVGCHVVAQDDCICLAGTSEGAARKAKSAALMLSATGPDSRHVKRHEHLEAGPLGCSVRARNLTGLPIVPARVEGKRINPGARGERDVVGPR